MDGGWTRSCTRGPKRDGSAPAPLPLPFQEIPA